MKKNLRFEILNFTYRSSPYLPCVVCSVSKEPSLQSGPDSNPCPPLFFAMWCYLYYSMMIHCPIIILFFHCHAVIPSSIYIYLSIYSVYIYMRNDWTVAVCTLLIKFSGSGTLRKRKIGTIKDFTFHSGKNFLLKNY